MEVLQNSWNQVAMPKQGMDALALPHGVRLCQPADLPLPDHMHRSVTLDRPPSSFRRVESETRCNPLPDETMILLDDVVHIKVMAGKRQA